MGVNVTFSRLAAVLGAAECAATHIVHLTDSGPLAWRCATNASDDHKVSSRHRRATHFTMDRMLPTPLEVFFKLYTEMVTARKPL
jgi:hypothetical protein